MLFFLPESVTRLNSGLLSESDDNCLALGHSFELELALAQSVSPTHFLLKILRECAELVYHLRLPHKRLSADFKLNLAL